MHLLYITFGTKTVIHSQAAFSIYTFLAQRQPISSITVLTDAPDYYQHLKGRVIIEPVTNTLLQEWRGPYDFFWRIKIKAIELLCQRYAGQPVMYLDTDTFLFKPWTHLEEAFVQNNAFMHMKEGVLSQSKRKTQKKMWQQLVGKSFAGLVIPDTESMWNAGVVGTPNTTNLQECHLALQLCDDMSAAGVTPRLIEQFALSIALNKIYYLQAAEQYIGHYWGNKEGWNNYIAHFLTAAFLKGQTTDQQIEALRTFDYKQIAVYILEKNTANRLHKLVNKMFKPKDIAFIEEKIKRV